MDLFLFHYDHVAPVYNLYSFVNYIFVFLQPFYCSCSLSFYTNLHFCFLLSFSTVIFFQKKSLLKYFFMSYGLVDSEFDFMDAFRSGDLRSLRFVHQLHYQPLCLFASKLIQQSDEAEDMVAEVFVKLWMRHSHFGSLQNIKAFLYISVRNTCFNYLKKIQRSNVVKKAVSCTAELYEEPVSISLIKSETLSAVHREVDLLPTQCRIIFKMLYVDGLKSQDIANKLGLSIHTVRAQRARGLQLIKKKVKSKSLSLAV